MTGHAWTEQGVRIVQYVTTAGRIVTVLRDREDRTQTIRTIPDGPTEWCTVHSRGRHSASVHYHRASRALDVHTAELEGARAAFGIGYRVHWRALQVTR